MCCGIHLFIQKRFWVHQMVSLQSQHFQTTTPPQKNLTNCNSASGLSFLFLQILYKKFQKIQKITPSPILQNSILGWKAGRPWSALTPFFDLNRLGTIIKASQAGQPKVQLSNRKSQISAVYYLFILQVVIKFYFISLIRIKMFRKVLTRGSIRKFMAAAVAATCTLKDRRVFCEDKSIYWKDKISLGGENYRIPGGKVLGNSEDVKEGEATKVSFEVPGGTKILFLTRFNKRVYCFGQYCPDSWEEILEPIFIGDKLISPYNLFSYDLKTGQPKFSGSFESLPVYKTIENNGIIYLAEDCDFGKSIIPKIAKHNKIAFIRTIFVKQSPSILSAMFYLRKLGYDGDLLVFNDKEIAEKSSNLFKNKRILDPKEQIQLTNKVYDHLTTTLIDYDSKQAKSSLENPFSVEKTLFDSGERNKMYNLQKEVKIKNFLGMAAENIHHIKLEDLELSRFGRENEEERHVVETELTIKSLTEICEKFKNYELTNTVLVLNPTEESVPEQMQNSLIEMAEKRNVQIVVDSIQKFELFENKNKIQKIILKESSKKIENVGRVILTSEQISIPHPSISLISDSDGYAVQAITTRNNKLNQYITGPSCKSLSSYHAKYYPSFTRNSGVLHGKVAAYNMMKLFVPLNDIPQNEIWMQGHSYLRFGDITDYDGLKETGSVSEGSYKMMAFKEGQFMGLLAPRGNLTRREALLVEGMKWNIYLDVDKLLDDEEGLLRVLEGRLLKKYQKDRIRLKRKGFNFDDDMMHMEFRQWQ